MEEKDLQSFRTDASLYNGQPTGTSTPFHVVGLASSTPSIQNDKDGVSVENARTPSKQWYVLRVSSSKVLKAKKIVDAFNIEYCVPMCYKQIMKHGKKHTATESLVPSFIFVHSPLKKVDAMGNFIKQTSVKSPHIIPVTSENIQYKMGDHAIVTESDFKGIQDRVARIAGQQRVIVVLFNVCLVMTTYIHKKAMELIINY